MGTHLNSVHQSTNNLTSDIKKNIFHRKYIGNTFMCIQANQKITNIKGFLYVLM